MGKLTIRQTERATEPGWLNDGNGLYLRISKGQGKSWIFRYRVNGKLRDHGLGSFSALTLPEAREKAFACRQMRLAGIDPISVKQELRQKQAIERAHFITFVECADRYIDIQREGWKNPKHVQQWENTLKTYAYPEIGDMAVSEIDTPHIIKVLEPIWTKKHDTAKRLKGRIEKILDWAKVNGFREGENPALWRGNLEHSLVSPKRLPKSKRQPSLPYSEVPEFWRQLLAREGDAAVGLQFLILTAVRATEARHCVWEEIHWDEKVWVIPAARMKSGRDHRIPLSVPALAILHAQYKKRVNDLVFNRPEPGEPLSENAFREVLKRMSFGHVTAHGFRSSFRNWSTERRKGGTLRNAAEAALAHRVSQDETEASYHTVDYFDHRVPLMEEWAEFCTSALTL